MNENPKSRFHTIVAEYGMLAIVFSVVSFCICLFGTLEAAETAPALIGRDLAWFCVYWFSVFMLLAAAGESFRPQPPHVQPRSPRTEVQREFAGFFAFWLTGCAAVAVASTFGIYLASGIIWSGFLMTIVGTVVCLLPLSALAILIRARWSTTICRCLVIICLVLGHNLDRLRDRLDLWHHAWVNGLFECAAVFIPDQRVPDWRAWLVFQISPPMSVFLTVVLSSLALSWFFLALAGALRARKEVAGAPMYTAELNS